MKLKFIIAAISALFPPHFLPNGNRLAMLNTHGGHSMFILSAYILKRVPMKKNERPLMFSIKYEKPVEGKNFAIALTKEMESQNLSKDDTTAWLKKNAGNLP